MINHVFISFSAVQLYDLSYIHMYIWVTYQAKDLLGASKQGMG